jgi:hypothetical protein
MEDEKYYLVWPVLTGCDASCIRQSIQGRELQRRGVHQHKISPAICIDLIKFIIDAINVVWNYCVVETAVCQECIDSKVIGTNPYRVYGVVAAPIHLKCVMAGGGIDVFGVCYESIDFVEDVWEWSIDSCEVSINYFVGTDRSIHSVIVELCAGVIC